MTSLIPVTSSTYYSGNSLIATAVSSLATSTATEPKGSNLYAEGLASNYASISDIPTAITSDPALALKELKNSTPRPIEPRNAAEAEILATKSPLAKQLILALRENSKAKLREIARLYFAEDPLQNRAWSLHTLPTIFLLNINLSDVTLGIANATVERRHPPSIVTEPPLADVVTYGAIKSLDKHKIINVSSGTGWHFIHNFLLGRNNGYKLENQAGLGMQVTPEGFESRDLSYATRSSQSYFDEPAILEAQIEAQYLTAAPNPHEAGIRHENIRHLKNIKITKCDVNNPLVKLGILRQTPTFSIFKPVGNTPFETRMIEAYKKILPEIARLQKLADEEMRRADLATTKTKSKPS